MTETETGRRYVRHFGAPRTLAESESVWLVGTAPAAGIIMINGEQVSILTAGMAFHVDLTTRLKPRNEAVIELNQPAELGEIVVEIRS